MQLRNKATGTSVSVGDVQGEKMLTKGWVLASKYKAPAKPTEKVEAAALELDPDVLAEAVAAELARLGVTPEAADEPVTETSGDDKPATRGQTGRATK